MSMYHMMNKGVNEAVVFLILPMLGKHPDEYPRFRDAFLKDEAHPEFDNNIHVYTRVGGGNRESYKEQIDIMKADPHYISDFDDSFDSTYASFVFKVPEQWEDDYLRIMNKQFEDLSTPYKEMVYHVYPKLKDKMEILFNKKTEDAGE